MVIIYVVLSDPDVPVTPACEQFDVGTRKTLTATCNHHPRSAAERVYLPRSAGGIGLKQLIFFIEVSCPADVNVPSKQQEKLHK